MGERKPKKKKERKTKTECVRECQSKVIDKNKQTKTDRSRKTRRKRDGKRGRRRERKREGVCVYLSSQVSILISTISHCSLAAGQIDTDTQHSKTPGNRKTQRY